MMTKKVIYGILIILLFIGIYIFGVYDNNQKFLINNTQLGNQKEKEGTQDDEYFRKNMMCLEKTDFIKKQVKEIYTVKITDPKNPFRINIIEPEIGRIFYSSKLNTCLFIMQLNNMGDDMITKYLLRMDAYGTDDQEIDGCSYPSEAVFKLNSDNSKIYHHAYYCFKYFNEEMYEKYK